MQKKITRNPPMTVKKLREFVKAYAPAFPEWKFVDKEYFIRIEGPIAQVIGFEALRSGAYRPMSAIHILVAPRAGMLHQFLDVKNREILATEHNDKKVAQIIKVMEEQFIPAIRYPLVPNEVLQICESLATDRIKDACGLAALNASCGNKERAMHWLDVLARLTEQLEHELYDWEQECVAFGSELQHQIESGNERIFLDKVCDAEKVRILR